MEAASMLSHLLLADELRRREAAAFLALRRRRSHEMPALRALPRPAIDDADTTPDARRVSGK